jgi:SAM-dependent MidA family methyltransferase
VAEFADGIAGAIAAEGGRVTFARFMELALTHPTLGYYSRVERLLRAGGDFSTAPALSPFFSRTLARLATELVDAALAEAAASGADAAAPGGPLATMVLADRPSVVELGGGEGHLAAAILAFWQSERPEWRDKVAYRIVEVGASLRERQAAAVAGPVAAGWEVGWGLDLEEACAGTRPVVMVGNEFLDTLPVHLLDVSGDEAREAYVVVAGPGSARTGGPAAPPGDLVQTWDVVSGEAAAEVELLFGTLDPRHLRALTEDGVLEVFPALGGFLRRVAGLMPSGSLVSVDYGEWFPGLSGEVVPGLSGDPALGGAAPAMGCGLGARPLRRRTIRGYFKHQLVADPLARPGRQDLTADVDFSALDLHGRREGFETVVFATLAAFLRGGGAEDELRALRAGTAETASDTLEADRQATVLESLLDEEDLGAAFKVMVQVRE